MKILIIGGNRFVGKRLAHLLAQSQHDVTLFNRGTLASQHPMVIHGDRRKLKDLSKITESHFDVIYDFACFDAEEAKLAVDFFHRLTQRYVFISSQSVYEWGSDLKEEDFRPEQFSFTPIVRSKENYAMAKRQAETVFHQQSLIKVTSVRFPLILGPDDYSGRLQWHVDRIKNGEAIYFPDVQAKVSLVHADDAARVLFHLLEHPCPGPLNIASPDPIALADLIGLIERKYQKTMLSSRDQETHHSPYGIDADWWMNVDRLKNIGFVAKPIVDWLPSLI